jgi:hypothetical protein
LGLTKNKFKLVPEFWLSVVYPIIIILFSWFRDKNFLYNIQEVSAKGLAFFFFFGDPALLFFTIIIGCYFYFKVLYVGSAWILTRLGLSRFSPIAKDFNPVIVSGIYLTIGIPLIYFTNIILYYQLLKQDPNKVASWSNTLMHWDYVVFNTYPSLTIQKYFSKFFEYWILFCYKNMSFFLSGMCVITAIFSTTLFRKFFISTILVLLLGVPLWLFFTAISPEEMFRLNILNITPNNKKIITLIDNLKLSPELLNYLKGLAKVWSNPKQDQFAITAFPSMHTAWGILVAYYGYKLLKVLSFILFPYCILNMIGTIYTLQHYAIDIPLGLLVAIAAIRIAECWVNQSDGIEYKKYYYLIQRD